MNIERLKLIRDALDRFPKNVAFNLSGWFFDIEDFKDYNFSYILGLGDGLLEDSNQGRKKINLEKCGTVCCAIGWACQDPELKKLGFKLDDQSAPSFQGKNHWQAVDAFLECESDKSQLLFSEEHYPASARTTLEDVKNRIDAKILQLSV